MSSQRPPAERLALEVWAGHPPPTFADDLPKRSRAKQDRLLHDVRAKFRALRIRTVAVRAIRHVDLRTTLSIGVRGEPPVPVPGYVFTDIEEAERTVFRLRWKHLTGQELDRAPASGG